MTTPTATMTGALALAAPDAADPRRITERDPDFQQVHALVEGALWRGLRGYVRALRAGKPSQHAQAASDFIAHQLRVLQRGYLAGHWEGERDYWHAVSARHSVQAHSRMSQVHGVGPEVTRMRRALMFYGAAAVAKMAREGQAAWAAEQRAKTPHAAATTTAQTLDETRRDETMRLDAKADAAMDAWLGGLTARVGMQADIAWTGMQDGYLAAGTVDPANPYAYIWWQLEPTAQHCGDCPDLAAGSPYTAPGSGGNELAQTPGDGGTECGAGCKCTLEYGSSQDVGAPSDFAPEWAKSPSADIAPMEPGQPLTPTIWDQRRAAAIAKAEVQRGASGTTDWDRRRDEAIAKAEAAQRGQGSDEWDRRRDAAIAKAGGAYGPVAPSSDTMAGQVDTTRVEVGGISQTTRDMIRVTPGAGAPDRSSALTDGQKQALDHMRGIALLWDAVRGTLPDFATYFNAASPQNLWQNRDLVGLNAAQRELVARYLQAQADFAANAPKEQE